MAGLGPLGPRAVTVRPPANPDVYAGERTYFKDCSGPGAADGTVPTASWMNHIKGQFEFAADQLGIDLANDQTSEGDKILWLIIQTAISRRLAGQTDGWEVI